MRVAVDWDGTLVDTQTQEWLPGAERALRQLSTLADVVVHSCRANWPEGRAQIASKLAEARLRRIRIEPKLDADLYIDDKARLPDWPAVLRELTRAKGRR